MSWTDNTIDAENGSLPEQAAGMDRRTELLAEWQALGSRTTPADRSSAEAALHGFYDAAGYFGPLRSVVWAESFPSFRRCLQALARDFCWLALSRGLGEHSVPATFPGRALWELLPGDEVLIGSRIVQNDWDWEEEEVPEFAAHRDLVPTAYCGRTWANVLFDVESGACRASSLPAHAARVLRHCAAFFPGPSVAVCCEFPAAIEVAETLESGGSFGVLTFRNGEKFHATPWGNAANVSEWNDLRQWRTLTAEEVLRQGEKFRRSLVETIGLRRIMERADLSLILELPDRELRRELIDSLPAEIFLKRCEKSGWEIQEVDEPDDYGRLLSIPIPDEEEYRLVEVLNSTPEPDGSFKNYFLRVPPHMESAREAVAWTFEMEETEYDPMAQT